MSDSREVIDRYTPASTVGKVLMVVFWVFMIATTNYDSAAGFAGGAIAAAGIVVVAYLFVSRALAAIQNAADKGKDAVRS